MRALIHFLPGRKKKYRRNCFIFFPILFFFVLLSTDLFSKQIHPTDHDSSIIDVSMIRFSRQLHAVAEMAIAPRNIQMPEILRLNYQKGLIRKYQNNVPGELIENSAVLTFTLANPADTAETVEFIPGFFIRKITVYSASASNVENTLKLLPDSSIRSEEYKGSRLLHVPARDTLVYFIQLQLLRTSSNTFVPRIIEKDVFRHWLKWIQSDNIAQDVITYVASGILLLMIFYSLAVYLQNRNKEFIYYSVYVFCIFILLFLKSFLTVNYSAFNFFFEEYLDFFTMVAGVFFYLIFVRKFLETADHHHFLHRFLQISEYLLTGLFLVYSCIYFFTDKYVILNIAENYVIKLFMLVIGIVFIVYSFFNKKDTLLRYLAAGNIALVVFSLISFFLMIFRWKIVPIQGHVLNRSLVYYELGLVIELMFFLSGLAYKNRRDLIGQVRERERFKQEKERQEFEKQMAVMAAQQEERNRISADMHDELGSGVTAIRLMSEIVKSKMKEDSLPEIEKISNSANELLGKMNTIIWTMKSSNDSLESLAAYIRAHAIEFFENTPVNCKVHIAISNNREISGEKRRNIFLSVKEALNNSVKHSNGTEVRIRIQDENNKLVIEIRDDGRGIDINNLRRFGNGLSNMKRRMQSVQGEFKIFSDNGAVLTFEIPL